MCPSIGTTAVGTATGTLGWLSTETCTAIGTEWPSIGTTVDDGTTIGTLGRESPSIGDESGMVGAALLTECMAVCVNGADNCAHLPKVVVFIKNGCFKLLLHAWPMHGPGGGTDSATSGCTFCHLPVSHANATAHHALNSVASLGDKGGWVAKRRQFP
jgi:hypothetical protein